MTFAYSIQANFSRGVLSPRVHGRTDIEHYRSGIQTGLNFFVMRQGGLRKRSGTQFQSEIKDSSKVSRLIPFRHSIDQAYILEIGENVIRKFTSSGAVLDASKAISAITQANPAVVTTATHGLATGDSAWIRGITGMTELNLREFVVTVLSSTTFELDGEDSTGHTAWSAGGTVEKIIETVTTYSEADIANLDYAQSADVMGLTHSDHVVRELTRSSNIAWTLAEAVFLDGPYLDEPISDRATLSLSASGNLVPDMTSASAPSGDVLSSVVLTDWRVFDRDDNSHANFDSRTSNDVWVGYRLDQDHAIIGITKANPGVVQTSAAHNLANGDVVFLLNAGGMTQVNNRHFTIANVTSDTFELEGEDTTGHTTYTNGGGVWSAFPIVINYSIISRSDVTRAGFRSWVLEALSSNETWVMLDAGTKDGGWGSEEMLSFDIPNRAGFVAYRLKIKGSDETSAGNLVTFTTFRMLLDPSQQPTITMTADKLAGINGDTGFKSTDVGRMVRYKGEDDKWRWFRITAFTDTKTVTVVQEGGPATSQEVVGSSRWRLGAWSVETGYPELIAFYQERRVFGRTTKERQKLWATRTNNFYDFGVEFPIVANDAISFQIQSGEVNAIQWLAEGNDLLIGTTGETRTLTTANSQEGFSATNIRGRSHTNFGAKQVKPVSIGSTLLFADFLGHMIREFVFSFEIDSFTSPELTILSDHLFLSPIKELAYAQSPDSIVHSLTEDGKIASITFERDQKIVGVMPLEVAPSSEDTSAHGMIESIASMPGDIYDELWMIVERKINGVTRRYIERLAEPFENIEAEDGCFLDCSLRFDAPQVVITGATQADPVVITTAGHSYSNGDTVRIRGMNGTATNPGMTELNGKQFVVANKTGTAFELTGEDGTAHTAYNAGGIIEIALSTFSGFNHLEGETIGVVADGVVLDDEVVTNGDITLSGNVKASKVVGGLRYDAEIQPMRLAVDKADGSTFSRFVLPEDMRIDVYETLGLKIGTDDDNMFDVLLRDDDDPVGQQMLLRTGSFPAKFEPDWFDEGVYKLTANDPLPCTIRAVVLGFEAEP